MMNAVGYITPIIYAVRKAQKFCSPTYWRRKIEWLRTWDGIHTIVIFVGHGRTGHTLVGHLLNQHPNIAIAHEYSLLDRLNNPNNNIMLHFKETIRRAQRKQFIGAGGYTFHKIRAEYSGSQAIRVIGDKSAGKSTQNLQTMGYNALQRIEDTQKILKLIFVIRNPYDIISTKALRGVFHGNARGPIIQIVDKLGTGTQYQAQLSEYLPEFAAELFRNMRTVQELTERYGKGLMLIRYHEFVADPRQQLREILRFLGLEEPPGYLDEAAKQVRPASRSRDLINYVWSDSARAEVAEQMRHFDFLANYSFESD